MSQNPAPATGRPTLGIAMIGSGLMAKSHTMAWRNLRTVFGDVPVDIRLVILADATEELAAVGAAQLGFERSTASWEEAINSPDVDIVDIVTPNFLHQEVAIAAARAGKHIWCEKPLAVTAEGARAMADAAEEAGVKTIVGFSYLRNPGLALAKRLVEQGEIGEPVSFTGSFSLDAMVDPAAPFTWRQDRALAGTGALGDLGAHVIAMARHLIGDIDAVAGIARTTVPQRPLPQGNFGYGEKADASAPMREVENEDISMCLMRFANGAIGSLESSRVAAGRTYDLSFTLTGTRGAIRFDQQHMYELQVKLAADADSGYAGFRRVDLGPGDGLLGALWPIAGVNIGVHDLKYGEARDLVEAIVTGDDAWADFREGWKVEQTIDAIDEASQNGTWVEIEAAR